MTITRPIKIITAAAERAALTELLIRRRGGKTISGAKINAHIKKMAARKRRAAAAGRLPRPATSA